MLKDLLSKANMTQATLAILSDVDLSTINNLANGRNMPTLATARAITEALAFALKRPLSVDDVFPPVAHEADATGEEFD